MFSQEGGKAGGGLLFSQEKGKQQGRNKKGTGRVVVLRSGEQGGVV